MMLFHVAVLIVVAELSCLRQSLVFGEGDLDFLSKKADVQHHRTKRWLWGGKVASILGCVYNSQPNACMLSFDLPL